MYRKVLASITATAMVISMLATAGFSSYAFEGEPARTETVQGSSDTEQEPIVIVGDVVVEATENYSSSAINTYGQDVSVNGSVEGQVLAHNNSDVNISGDVVSNGDNSLAIGGNYNGLVTAGSGATVNIGGNVDGSRIITDRHEMGGYDTMYNRETGNVTKLWDYETETVSGGAGSGVSVDNGGSVSVGGDVVAGMNGAYVMGESSLYVGGDVVSNGQERVDSGWLYDANNGAVIKMRDAVDEYGNVRRYENGNIVREPYVESYTNREHFGFSYTNGNGIYTDGEGNIVVGGNVSGQDYGISITTSYPDKNGRSGSIVVLGTIKADEVGINIGSDYEMGHYIEDETGTTEEKNEKAGKAFAKEIPEITVYAIDAPKAITDGRYEDGDTIRNYDAYKVAYNTIVNAINYIIKQDDSSNEQYGIRVNATQTTVAGQDILTTKINQAFSVAANLPEGYTIDGGNNVSVVENGDGTFTLTLTDVKGGINIKAKLRPVSDSSQDNTSAAVVVEEVSTSAPAGGVVVTNASSAPSDQQTAELISKISGDRPAQTATFDFGKISVAQYKEAVISNVQSVPQNGALNIVSNKLSVFDTSMMQAISARSDIDVNVVFSYGGKQYKVVIPAGYDVMSLLDEHGYCGYLRLLAILGGQEIA